MNPKNLTSKICESCGQTFSCGALAGACWCMKVSTNPKLLEALRKTYSDCLCEACLNKMNPAKVKHGLFFTEDSRLMFARRGGTDDKICP